MDIQKNKNFKHELYLDEYDICSTSIAFIENLRKDYTKYNQRWLNDYRKKEKILDDADRDLYLSKRPNINKYRMIPRINKKTKKRVSFKPEFLLNRSPLTIIDGPWGSGKTHFLNETFSLIKENKINIDEEIKVKVPILEELEYEINCVKIQRFVSIDAWKYSATNDIVTDFFNELSIELSTFYKWSSKSRKIKKALLSLFNNVILSWINKFLRSNFKPRTQKNKNIFTLNKYINKTTLLVVDNIERLGKNAWEIIRIVQRLSELKNLIFVLPMNLSKFNELCQIFGDSNIITNKTNSGEWNIYKYINMPYYKLTQSYVGLFLSLGFSKEHSIILNKVFIGDPDQTKNHFSIRELKDMLSYKNINSLKSSNILELLSFVENNELCKMVDGGSNVINNYIREEINKYEQIINKIISEYRNCPINYKEFYDENLFNTNYSYLEPKLRCLSEDFLEITYLKFKRNIELTNDINLKHLLIEYTLKIKNLIEQIENNEVLKIINRAAINTCYEFNKKMTSLELENKYFYIYKDGEKSKFISDWHNYVISNIIKLFK